MTANILTRCSPSFKKEMEEYADEVGLSLSELVRLSLTKLKDNGKSEKQDNQDKKV